MDSLLIFLLCISGLCALLLVRNHVAYNISIAGIDRASELARIAIKREEPWEIYHDMRKSPSYDRILFDLTLWSAEKAYPELFKHDVRNKSWQT